MRDICLQSHRCVIMSDEPSRFPSPPTAIGYIAFQHPSTFQHARTHRIVSYKNHRKFAIQAEFHTCYCKYLHRKDVPTKKVPTACVCRLLRRLRISPKLFVNPNRFALVVGVGCRRLPLKVAKRCLPVEVGNVFGCVHIRKKAFAPATVGWEKVGV